MIFFISAAVIVSLVCVLCTVFVEVRQDPISTVVVEVELINSAEMMVVFLLGQSNSLEGSTDKTRIGGLELGKYVSGPVFDIDTRQACILELHAIVSNVTQV